MYTLDILLYSPKYLFLVDLLKVGHLLKQIVALLLVTRKVHIVKEHIKPYQCENWFWKQKSRVQGHAHLIKGTGSEDHWDRESQEIIHSSNLPKSKKILDLDLYSTTNPSTGPIRSTAKHILNLFFSFTSTSAILV